MSFLGGVVQKKGSSTVNTCKVQLVMHNGKAIMLEDIKSKAPQYFLTRYLSKDASDFSLCVMNDIEHDLASPVHLVHRIELILAATDDSKERTLNC